jgi:hypothetical protein
MSSSNAARSTVRPASSAISSVRSIGKPYVSCRRKASLPDSDEPPERFVSVTESSRIAEPAARVRRNVASSARAYCSMRS